MDEEVPLEEIPVEIEIEIPVEEEPKEKMHFDNLAEGLVDIGRIAAIMAEWVEVDSRAREIRQKEYERGLEVIGLKKEVGEGPFKGASKVTHPLILEAAIQFNSRALHQFFPPGGPVKCEVLGEVTPELEQQAERVKKYLDYHLLTEDKGYFPDTDQMLFMLPLVGAVYRKTYYDPVKERVSRALIKQERGDCVLLPYTASSLAGATRVTHLFELNKMDFDSWVEKDYYLPIKSEPVSDVERSDEADAASLKEAITAESDKVYRIAEIYCHIKVGEEHGYFMVSYEVDSNTVVRIQRNWAEGKPGEMLHSLTQYIYFPGIGPEGMGLIQAIGGLNESATGAVRALLDTAARQNCPGGFKSNDAKMKSGDFTIEPGVFKDVDMSSDELQRAFWIPPFPQPSQALGNLYQILIGTGQRFSSTTDAMVGQAANTAPVGTTVALIEQANAPFTAVHKRIHNSFAEELRITSRLLGMHGPEEYPYRVNGGEAVVFKADFDDRVDVNPFSDPTLITKTQKIAIAQEKLKLAQLAPGLYDLYELHKGMLESLDSTDVDAVLPDPKNLPYTDPVSEGAYAMVSRPISAKVDEDHQAHLIIHDAQIQAGQDMPQFVAAMQAHKAEHLAVLYMIQSSMQLGMQLPPLEFRTSRREDVPPEVNAQITAQAALLIQQAQQQVQQQMMQQQQMTQQPSESDIADMELKRTEIALDDENKKRELSIKENDQQLRAQELQIKGQLGTGV
jgi:hypothetical protein